MDELAKLPITTTATVVALTAGDPPSLTTVKRAVNSQGIARHIVQKVAVRDAELFQRLCGGVSKGDEIRLTLITDWEAVDCRMTLLDFAKSAADASVPPPAKELASQAA